MQRFICQFVLLLVVIVFTNANGTDCFASCGDWLAEPNAPMEQHSSEKTTEESEEIVPQNESNRNSQRPCHGPECRQAPGGPIHPLPTKIDAPTNDAYLSNTSRKRRSVSRIIAAWELTSDTAISGYRNALERPPQFDL